MRLSATLLSLRFSAHLCFFVLERTALKKTRFHSGVTSKNAFQHAATQKPLQRGAA